ncbi:uncharacterized protein [Procambarus clarkii]|uniref:uncharacterized protein n=1 Tax=Procambarus clarkii TaxID=6728 RepID=UPI0037441457
MIAINPLKVKATAIRCGHIDESITQTKILSNSASINTLNENNGGNSFNNSGNNEWNKIGRFSRNYSSNSYANICLVACGLQKLLPKDSKAKEPKSTTVSEVGFIDLLNTPDTPQRCGIILEMIPDVIIASTSMCNSQPDKFLFTYLPQLRQVGNPSQLDQKENSDLKKDFELLYIGYDREKIPNIMGPNARAISRPNAAHPPRISNSLQSYRHYAGISVNTHSVGEIHQKTVIHTLYTTSRMSKLLPIPCQNPMVAVVNWHNPEDSITVKQDSIDRGLFSGVSYETSIVRYNYGSGQNALPTFCQTYFDQHTPLQRGVQLGILKGVNPKCQEDNSLLNFTNGEIEFVHIDANTLALIWNGKIGDLKEPIYDDSVPVSTGTKNGKGSRNDYRVTVNDPHHPSLERQQRLKKSQYSLAFKEHHPNYITFRYFKIDSVDLPVLQSWRFSLITVSPYIPSLGDKLQTPTSQKGVIGRLVSEQDMPYIKLMSQGDMFSSNVPIDVLVNPHSLKRQAPDLYCNTFDNLNYMDAAFTLTFENVIEHLQWGRKTCTGILMNPHTGEPYLNRDNEPILASLYEGYYMCVTNHRANATMHTSRADEVVFSELTGAPVRGRRGGFSTGPMELVSFRSIGAARIHTELTQIRSDMKHIELETIQNNETETEKNENESGVICGSKYLQRK